MGEENTHSTDKMWSRIACFAALLASCHAGLLGAGTGEGSCAAAPFRANPSALKYVTCPQYSSCCSEFGYCRPKSEWDLGVFRDCNGVSNGRALEEGAIIAENAAAANGDTRGIALLNTPAGGSVPTAAGAPIPAPAVAPAVAVAAGGALVGANGALVGANGALVGANGALVGGAGLVGANGAIIGGNGALIGANGAYINGAGAYGAGAYGTGAYGLSGLWDGYFGGAGLTGYGLPVVKKA